MFVCALFTPHKQYDHCDRLEHAIEHRAKAADPR
jgi:hypothetical protein